MVARAILELDGLEIRTDDAVCVRTLWGLMATALTNDDLQAVEGEPLQPPWTTSAGRE